MISIPPGIVELQNNCRDNEDPLLFRLCSARCRGYPPLRPIPSDYIYVICTLRYTGIKVLPFCTPIAARNAVIAVDGPSPTFYREEVAATSRIHNKEHAKSNAQTAIYRTRLETLVEVTTCVTSWSGKPVVAQCYSASRLS